MDPIVGRNEQGITFAAVGYSWASGGVAVVAAVPGAGMTNAATALLEATLSQDRVLFIVEPDSIQAGLSPVVARYCQEVTSPDDVAAAVHNLLDRLEYGRPGAAILAVSSSVLGARTEVGPERREDPMTFVPGDDLLAEAAYVLSRAERPLICAGATALAANATAAIVAIAEQLGAPVLTDGFAKGVVPEAHPLALGRSWTVDGPADALVDESDAVLVIGAPVAAAQNTVLWDPRMITGSRSPDELKQVIILVDWDEMPTGSLPARLRVYGHVPSILRGLADALPPRAAALSERERHDEIRAVCRNYAGVRIPSVLPALEAFVKGLPSGAILLLDSLIGLWLDRLVEASGARLVRFPWGTGTLGFGIPAAVGVQLAQPDRQVIAVGGDGAFLYNPQELATMKLYGQNPMIVVANDNGFGAVEHNLQENYGRSAVHRLANPDFIALAESFGMHGVRLNSPEELATLHDTVVVGNSATVVEVPLALKPPTGLYDWSFVRNAED
jgi:acetolactate synthase-1/2/3 large subunit